MGTALPLLDEDGHILKWHDTIVDMHDWKHAQEELRSTQAHSRMHENGAVRQPLDHRATSRPPVAELNDGPGARLPFHFPAEPRPALAQRCKRLSANPPHKVSIDTIVQ